MIFSGFQPTVPDASELPAHLAKRTVHDDRAAEPGQVMDRHALHALWNLQFSRHARSPVRLFQGEWMEGSVDLTFGLGLLFAYF